MRRCLGLLAALVVLVPSLLVIGPGPALAQPAAAAPRLKFTQRVVDADQSFRGLDAVSPRTAWVAGGSITDGGDGKVYRTVDGGRTWRDVSPPRSAGLQFRDVEALGGGVALVLSIGPGRASRVYRTADAGRTWSLAFRNEDRAAFYDCMDFYAGGRVGLAMSDPVDGRFRIARTTNGGRSWRVLPRAGMPRADGEFGFAASGDCLVTTRRTAFLASGGEASRVYRSRDQGLTWRATPSRIPGGESAGVFGLAFRGLRGVAVGGDFEDPADGTDATAYLSMRTPNRWRSGGDLRHLAEDASFQPGRRLLLATGESGDVAGTSISRDRGLTWRRVSRTGWHTLECTRRGCWTAGGGGRVAFVSVAGAPRAAARVRPAAASQRPPAPPSLGMMCSDDPLAGLV